MVNAEFAQLWLFDQTCAELWTAVHDVVGGTLRTYRFPIDRPSILTQAAVSRSHFHAPMCVALLSGVPG